MVRGRHVWVVIGLILLVSWPAEGLAGPGPDCAESEDCETLHGHVRLAGSRAPLSGATVVVVPAPPDVKPGRAGDPLVDGPAWRRRTTTDGQGAFSFDHLPRAMLRVIVIADEAERDDRYVDPSDAGRGGITLYLQPSDDRYRTVVESQVEDPVRPPVSHRLERAELETVPGSQGDPLRALHNMPGVTRMPGNLGDVIVRGSRAVVYVGAHPVPRGFHIMGLASIFPGSLVEDVQLVPGNLNPRYGNAVGGLVDLRPRSGRRDRVHGSGQLDLLGAGATSDGPLGRGSFAVGARRAWADAVLGTVNRIDPSADFLLPRYWDYQGWTRQPLPGNASLVVRVLGSGDRVRDQERDYASGAKKIGFDLSQQFHRVDAEFWNRHGSTTTLISPAFRFDRTGEVDGRQSARRFGYVPSFRAELGHHASHRFSIVAGTELQVEAIDVERTRPTPPDFETSETTRVRATEVRLGVYLTGNLSLGPVELVPGVRFNAYARAGKILLSPDPRVLLRWRVSDRVAIALASGLHSRSVTNVDQSVAYLLPDNWDSPDYGVFVLSPALASLVQAAVAFEPDLSSYRLERSWHNSAAVTVDLGHSITLQTTGFFHRRRADTLRVVHPAPEYQGQILYYIPAEVWSYGGDVLLRRRLARGLYGWIGYTLMWNEYRPRPNTPAEPTPTEWDQRHNLNVLASYALPHNWRIGARFRLVTGSAYTPIVGSVLTDPGSPDGSSPPRYEPTTGTWNSARFPTFHQLDLRIDKTWYPRYAVVTAYVDVQNVYNHQNAEALVYTPDYRRVVSTAGMPVFPSMGVRVEF